ncbi:MAG: hypothetical protein J6M59_08980 [Bacteroidaceae bacterium]|jgi:hypothetical protein|uniref:hypothetical protein n=1 Tax=unclassified Bacteroides TaxID=2646097 RepID=UPI00068A956F|nr:MULTISPECIES: hypothetical protein [unclassified Bacteroides]MBP3245218.1 hypothetical protein [Bacteroidaceae bacterium]SDF23950.1 hypothetical protein SAMN05216518_104139 [Bacteroidales bacterium KHT7]MBP5219768.1 hypothetical protein [Bacteroidaceae bacterium]MBQ1677554.1 hypothetical protein [Bacteroidaceae bacterium]MBQ2054889.1 hypothetical protein [Bacteroidaceae bacterium]
MRINRFAFLLVLLVAAVNVFAGNAEEKKKGKTKPVYGFGYSFSITDSTVYFTEILELPEAKLQKKTKFLENRQMYSDQLKRYLEKGEPAAPDRTCTVFFSKNHATLKSIYLRIRRRNQLDKEIKTVKELTPEQFVFNAVKTEDE